MKEENILWASTGWLTPIRYKKIIKEYGNLEKAWDRISKSFLISSGETEKGIEKLFNKKKELNLNKEKKLLEKHNAKVISIEDENYPKRLKEIPDHPVFLYVQGEIKKEDEFSISVVGSRKISPYGKQVLENIIPIISEKLTVVSGLAIGVDGLSHKLCIENNGRTLAIVGTGLDTVYPSENTNLAKKIINGNGAIISELPFGTAPDKFNFPRRNRIVAGISLGTLIVEAKEKSGSLITSQLALDYNREVFSIPGNIFSSNSSGSNNLIKKGIAKLVQSPNDIFEELNIEEKIKGKQIGLQIKFEGDKIEEEILKSLDSNGKDLGQIGEETDLSVSEISSKLIMLELRGYVLNIGMGVWVKK